VGLNHVPARDHIADGERFENYAGQGRTSRVSTYTRSPGCETAYCLGLRMAKGRERRARRLPALPLTLADDAAHHGSRNPQRLLAEQDGELVLAPAGVALA